MKNIDHVAFTVKSIDKAVEWYVTQIGAVIKYQDSSWAMLHVGDIKLALVLPGDHPNHFAIRCNSIDEFPVAAEEISTHRDGSHYIYLSDPFGNAIEWIYYPSKDD